PAGLPGLPVRRHHGRHREWLRAPNPRLQVALPGRLPGRVTEATMPKRFANLAFMTPGIAWLAVFFLVPMIALATYSFWSVSNYQIVPGFSLHNYRKAVGDPIFLDLTIRTIRIAVITTVLSMIIAYPVAYY